MAVSGSGPDIAKLIRPYLPAVAGVAIGIVFITLFAIFDRPEQAPPRVENPPLSRAAREVGALTPKIRIDPAVLSGRKLPFRPPRATTRIEVEAPVKLGLTPEPAASEQPAWRRFAVRTIVAADRPLVAVLIDDMGLDMPHSAEAVGLPAPLTLSYLPYADRIGRQVAAARNAGHELMVHVSMEPESKHLDPGPKALLMRHGAIETISRLDWALDRFSGYVGVNNHMGSSFTTDVEAMTLVLGEFKRRGLLYVDSRTTTRSVAPEVAARLDLPFAVRDVFLDDDTSAEVVAAQLLRVEEIARRTGSAIAIGHPRPTTLKVLRSWLSGLERRGFVLVPVSAVVSRRHRPPEPVRASR